MGKIFWFDCETTGVNASINAIIQISGLIEIDGEILESLNFNVKPFTGAQIDKRALEVNKITEKELLDFPSHMVVYGKLITILSKYIAKYDTTDKFVLAGYNVGFDDGFLRNFFLLNNDKYYGSYFAWPKIDVAHCVAEEYSKGLRLINFKLETLCKQFGISIAAHDAMSDIIATRDLYYKLKAGIAIP